jgi:hypothetical protein
MKYVRIKLLVTYVSEEHIDSIITYFRNEALKNSSNTFAQNQAQIFFEVDTPVNPYTSLRLLVIEQVRASSIHFTRLQLVKSLSLSSYYNPESMSSSVFLPPDCALCH